MSSVPRIGSSPTGSSAPPSGGRARPSRGRGSAIGRAWRHLPIGRKGLVVVGLPLFVTLLAVGPLVLNELRNNEVESRVRHSLEVRASLSELGRSAISVESAARGYVLVASEKLSRDFDEAKAATWAVFDRTSDLVRDNPEQTARLDAVRSSLQQRFIVFDSLVEARRAGIPPTLSAEVQQQGAALAANLDQALDDIQRAEVDLLNERTRRGEAGQRRQLLLAGASASLGIAAAVAASALFGSGVARRVRRLEDRTTSMLLPSGGDPAGGGAPPPLALRTPPAPPPDERGGRSARARRHTDELGELEAAFEETRAVIAERDDALRREAARLAAVADVQLAIAAGPLDAERIMWGVVGPAMALTGADGAAIVHVDADMLVCDVAVGDAVQHARTTHPGGWNVGNLRPGQVLWSADTRTDPRIDQALIEPFGARSIMVAPVLFDHEVGYALAVYASRPHAFDTSDERTLGVFGGLLGAALSHAAAFRARADALAALGVEVEERRQAEIEAAEARDAAERANRAKSEFLSRMSHELRTPLNAVLGFGQLLELEDLDEEHLSSISHITKAGYHLLDLINEVLDIARIESGRMSVSLEAVSVQDVVNEAIDLVRPLACSQDVQLPRISGHAHVWADRQRLKQVVLNLLANAVKYNRPGGRVTLDIHEQPSGRHRISVSDTGPGIAPEQIERLFVPFERLGAELTDVEGTGLGLALSQRLVEAMDGELTVVSEVGTGSTFSIELAGVEPVPAPRRPGTASPGSVGGGEVPEVERRTVLYIEDDHTDLQLVQRILARRAGVTLLSAMDGRSGVEAAREHRPHLVLVELDLPDMTGGEVLAKLRADPLTAALPVVIVSCDAAPDRAGDMVRGGAAAHLTKPFDVSELLDLVDDLLRTPGVPS